MTRHAPIDMSATAFRAAGHALVDQIADWLAAMPDGPIVRDQEPSAIRSAIGHDLRLQGGDVHPLIRIHPDPSNRVGTEAEQVRGLVNPGVRFGRDVHAQRS